LRERAIKLRREFKYRCRCGAVYRFQGTEEEMERFLDSQFWMCELGRHVGLGRKRDYLTLVEVGEELSDIPEIEPKRDDELEACELPEGLEHIGFGVFIDREGNIWDYRLGPRGERLYSKRWSI
jgi:hypothetical protein